MPQQQNIKLILDRTHLSLTIDRAEEPFYRLARDRYNQRVGEYRAQMPSGSVEEDRELPRLMAALDMALMLEVSEHKHDPKPVEDRLKSLCSRLDSFLAAHE